MGSEQNTIQQLEMVKNIGFFLFNGVQPLDFVGPWDVFNSWAKNFSPDVKCITFGETTEQVMSPNGLSSTPQHSLSTLPPLTYLVIPGGEGTELLCRNQGLVDKLGQLVGQAEAVLTVCTGAFILQATGAVNQVDITTYWRAADVLRSQGGRVRGQRIVQDGKFWSGGGVTSGIDLALAFVSSVSGREVAGKIQLMIEYFPSQENYADRGLVDQLPPYRRGGGSKQELLGYLNNSYFK